LHAKGTPRRAFRDSLPLGIELLYPFDDVYRPFGSLAPTEQSLRFRALTAFFPYLTLRLMHQGLRPSHHVQATTGLALACLFWGLSFPASKALTLLYLKEIPGESSWFVVGLQGTLRFGIAAIVMVILSWRTLCSLTMRETSQGLFLGLFGGVGMVFQVDGLAYTTASTSAFLTQTYCILVPLYHAVVARRFPRPVQVVATAGVIAGIVVLSKIDWTQFRMGRGECETLLSTVFFTGQILVLDAPQFFQNRTKMVSSVMFLSTAVVFAIVSILSNRSFDSYKIAAGIGQQFYLIAILVIFCTLLAFNLMNRCQKYIPASEAALIYTLEPVSTSLFATFLPVCLSALVGIEYDNEQLSMSLLAGGGLILFANLVMQIWGHTPVPHAGETPAPTTPHPGDLTR
jgi:drug/metabolite transporter (DMT)-like permease